MPAKAITDHSHDASNIHLPDPLLSLTNRNVRPADMGQNLNQYLKGLVLYDVILRCSRQSRCSLGDCLHILNKLLNLFQQLNTQVLYLTSFNVGVTLQG